MKKIRKASPQSPQQKTDPAWSAKKANF